MENKSIPVFGQVERVGYYHTIEGSHQFTLYGLQQALNNLKKDAENEVSISEPCWLKNINYLLTGIENSIKDDKEILPKIYHRFDPIPTEVLREGVEVFGTEQEFKEWLDKPNAFLSFKKPSELSDKEILDELGRIKNGIV